MGLTEKSFLERNEEMGIFKTDCNVKSNQSGDLIRRSAAIEAFDDERVDRNYGDVSPESVIRVIESIPAVDAVPVVHGRWSEKRWMTDDDWGVINHRAIVCSACKGEIADGEQTRYCPNCGAKMDCE